MSVWFFFLTGDNSYLSTVQIIDSLGPRRVQVDRGGSAGCAGLPEIYRDSSIPRGERGKYAIRVGRTVNFVLACKKSNLGEALLFQMNISLIRIGT